MSRESEEIPNPAIVPLMSMFFIGDCQKALNAGGLTLEAQRILVEGVAAMRDRLAEIEQTMLEGRPAVFEWMADLVAQRAQARLGFYSTLSRQSAVEKAVWDGMLDLGFRGPDLRQRAAAKLHGFARSCSICRREHGPEVQHAAE